MQMATSAADLSAAVLTMFAGLEDDERLAGQGLAKAFAAAFPSLPADSDVPGLTGYPNVCVLWSGTAKNRLD